MSSYFNLCFRRSKEPSQLEGLFSARNKTAQVLYTFLRFANVFTFNDFYPQNLCQTECNEHHIHVILLLILLLPGVGNLSLVHLAETSTSKL